jgi:hypothetical protein
MNDMTKRIITLIALAFILTEVGFACTTVIISGKFTNDGRPLLWKHRDSDAFDNKLVYLDGGKYRAIALIDSEEAEVENIWIGFNSAGFSIMNSASYNLKGEDTTKIADLEGVFMKAALLACATVDEFEKFIRDYPKPMGVEANFGVIDAQGGAAYFETDNFNYSKLDANDPKIAPHGYLIHTNYSFTGEPSDGAGYIRYETAEQLFYKASAMGNLSVEYILETMMTSLENSLTGESLTTALQKSSQKPHFMYYQDCINRYSSVSSVVIQGVRNGERPEYTTMWSKIGFPLGAMVIPVWLNKAGDLPRTATAPGSENALACDKALMLKKTMVPIRRGSGKYYIDLTKVVNVEQTGILQRLAPVNNEIIGQTLLKMEQWRGKPLDPAEVRSFYDWLDLQVIDSYKQLFGI